MFEIEPTDISDSGPCECCGSMSRVVEGVLWREGLRHAEYLVQWTLGQVERHGAEFYVILGDWGEGSSNESRYAVAIHLWAQPGMTGFQVMDAEGTLIADHPVVGSTLKRTEVVGTPMARKVFDLVDLVWLHDSRISEVVMTFEEHRGQK